ncbi:amidohydrolase family protein [Dictyobacter formicarum]|uniref:Amidohydrolase n=1 Tax=Dictyobacter formicarum TaxID=2778368 RepID=A0ABQ3VEA5_9CHLR|nr:amidohydrolase family protein [Dictyobacter formicarum]GHO83831.1 amidohydrolase [Dictyobacter formicarum]
MEELNNNQRVHFPIFDSHLHIVDPRFPLVANQGYLPDTFTVDDYRARTAQFQIIGGAIVSGSFQAEDQTYLLDALQRLGPGFVGVTQLSATVSDQEIQQLNAAGVRAVRFNVRRGGVEVLKKLETLARRVYDLAGWHAELYIDSRDLAELAPLLASLPRVCIDHLGLSQAGFDVLLRLVEQGIYVKATGFGRVDFAVPQALQAIAAVNPAALLFATDLPCPRAPRPFLDSDVDLVIEALGDSLARRVFSENALAFYHPGHE